jgi:hypothetical protein
MTLYNSFSALHRAHCAPVATKCTLASGGVRCMAAGVLGRIWRSSTTSSLLACMTLHTLRNVPAPRPRTQRLA